MWGMKDKRKKKNKAQGMFLRRWKTQTLMLDIEAERSRALERWLTVRGRLLNRLWSHKASGLTGKKWSMEPLARRLDEAIIGELWRTMVTIHASRGLTYNSLSTLYGTFLGWQRPPFFKTKKSDISESQVSQQLRQQSLMEFIFSSLQDLQNRQNPVRWHYNSRNAFFPKRKVIDQVTDIFKIILFLNFWPAENSTGSLHLLGLISAVLVLVLNVKNNLSAKNAPLEEAQFS